MNDQIEVIETTTLAVFSEFEANLAEFKKRYDGVQYDLTDPEQEKMAKADKLSIGKVVIALDKEHAAMKAPLKAQVDKIDGARKQIKDQLLLVKKGITNQLDDYEAKIVERRERISVRIEEIENAVDLAYDARPEAFRGTIKIMEKVVIDEEHYGDRVEEATGKYKAVMLKLREMLEDAETREKDAVELEKLRISDGEMREATRIREMQDRAKEAAIKEADRQARKEILKIEAEKDKIKRDAEEATQKALEEQRTQHIREKMAEEDRRAAIEKAAWERYRAEEVKKATESHRSKIQEEAFMGFLEAGFSKTICKDLVDLIGKGVIPHVSLNY